MAGHAIRRAAADALERWRRGQRPAVGSGRYRAPATQPLDAESPSPHVAYTYFALWVELVVDIGTGRVHIERVVCGTDAGRAIHPAMVAGQLAGGVVQAVGYALTEDLRVADGCIVDPRLSSYLIPTVADAPEVLETVVLEEADPSGPWGARGIGEAPFIALAPAVAAALHDATGVWLDSLPMTPERVARALAAASGGDPG